MAALCVILQLASFAHSMPTANLVNITILAPEGTTNHSNSHLFCPPTKARDVALFFFESYLAHSATVRTLPGEPFLPSLLTIIFALLFPATGTARGVRAILQGSTFDRDPVRAAVRDRAVCEVVRRRYWRAKHGDVVRNLKITRKESVPETPLDEVIIDIREPFEPLSEETGVFLPASRWTSTFGRSVHGRCKIPPGYALAIVPKDAQVERDDRGPETGEHEEKKGSLPKIRAVCAGSVKSCWNCFRNFVGNLLSTVLMLMKANKFIAPSERRQAAEAVSSDVASSFGFSKGILGVLQLVWASYTLARTRGDQLERYGYAAFGLTVIPYLLMTFINLFSLVITPSYSHVYLASSQIMEEAKKENREGQFKGEIGRLKNELVDDSEKREKKLVDVRFEEIEDQLYLTPLREADKPGGDQTYELNRSILEENLGAATGGRYKVKWKSAPSDIGISPLIGSLASRRQDPDVLISTTSRPPPEMPDNPDYATVLTFYASFFIGFCSIAFVGGFSRFQAGESTRAQRAWTMSWLAFGIFLAPLPSVITFMLPHYPKNFLYTLKLGLVIFTYAVPALGGFVVVSQMIWSYGNCERLF